MQQLTLGAYELAYNHFSMIQDAK